MQDVPSDLLQRLKNAGQEHVLDGWEKLAPAQRRGLIEQLSCIDLLQLQALYQLRDQASEFCRRW